MRGSPRPGSTRTVFASVVALATAASATSAATTSPSPSSRSSCTMNATGAVCRDDVQVFTLNYSVCRSSLGLDRRLSVASAVPLTWASTPGYDYYKLSQQRAAMHARAASVWGVQSQDGRKYAFKFECRPPEGTTGFQGWAEIAVSLLAQILHGEESVVPCAAGTVVPLLLPGQKPPRRMWQPNFACPGSGGLHIGALLPWMEWDHRVFPPELESAWKLYRPGVRPTLNASERGLVRQLTQLFALDYLTLNADRIKSNCLIVNGTLIGVDFGAAFGGMYWRWLQWDGAVCDADFGYFLSCPIMLGHWRDPQTSEHCRKRNSCSLSKHYRTSCKKGGIEWCLWSRSFVNRLRGLLAAWDAGMADAWQRALQMDPVFRYLFTAHNSWSQSPRREDVIRHTALWRSTAGCPGAPDSAKAPSPSPPVVLGWLALGIRRRLETLLAHVGECVEKHGEEYVYQLDKLD
eukprot:TRINITY_DN65620_c0_g1_i1.p1 TRINITY_DN65620_c0_g1~~TRINITY_DN65620_c0_g1_i1.p1  ORF type:complete len:462 (+),score=64.85 TRINITY_DN65620_c0_g1_i1:114-1499(+)